MKIIFGLLTLFSINAVAADPNFDLSEQKACVMQIMKEAPASLVEACGGVTLVNQGLQPFSTMPQAAIFQDALKQAFIAKFDASKGLKCQEWDNSTALIVICTQP